MAAPDPPSDPRTPRVDHVCIALLAIEWVFFGSLHFAEVERARVEIPDWIAPSLKLKTFIVIVTGMIEVPTGILILLPAARRWAAWMSLLLLTLFVFAIYHMLAHDSAMPFDPAFRTFIRVLLIPNHVMLALCAVHLLRVDTRYLGPARVLEGILNPGRVPSTVPAANPTGITAVFAVALVMLAANIAGFFAICTSRYDLGTPSLWAMACLASGALVGFLFGVPKFNSKGAKAVAYRPNSNIEVVSDWLTKIIVGVGLVEFRDIGAFVSGLSVKLGRALSPAPDDQSAAASFALALIVYFSVAGLIQGYLLTRMYLGKQFENNENLPAVMPPDPAPGGRGPTP